MVRAVRGGGTVLVDLGGWHDSTWTAVEKHFVSEAGIDKPRVGAVKIDEVDALMAELGAHPRTLEPIPGSRPFTYGALLDRLERGIYSFTWLVDEPTRLRAVAATRVWAAETLGPLDEVREARWEITYHAYDVA
jgi:hypothetical protein